MNQAARARALAITFAQARAPIGRGRALTTISALSCSADFALTDLAVTPVRGAQ
ncbi:MAG: hypothetical protein WCI29_11795 [Actinomycetes bacterium]